MKLRKEQQHKEEICQKNNTKKGQLKYNQLSHKSIICKKKKFTHKRSEQ